jgi:hypothetical protein
LSEKEKKGDLNFRLFQGSPSMAALSFQREKKKKKQKKKKTPPQQYKVCEVSP